MAKVHWGLISVRCSELRGVRFSEVRNVLCKSAVRCTEVVCFSEGPLYRGFTVHMTSRVVTDVTNNNDASFVNAW